MGRRYGFVIQEHCRPRETYGIVGHPKEVLTVSEKGLFAEAAKMKGGKDLPPSSILTAKGSQSLKLLR